MTATFPRLAMLASFAAGLLSFAAPAMAQVLVELEPAVAEIPEPAPPKRADAQIGRAGVTPRPAEFLANQPGVNDNVERVLLFGPRGPILVQATIFIDGQPYLMQREKLIQQVLEQADANKDGKSTWEEGMANPKFLFGRFAVYFASNNRMQRDALVKQYDRNANGIVDRDEVNMVFSTFAGGSAFTLMPGGVAPLNPDLRSLLDSNNDGRITAEELAGFGERLKSRDANGNDLVEIAELGGSGAGNFIRSPAPVLRTRPASPTTTPTSFLLKPGIAWANVRSSLLAKYGREGKLVAESFPLMPHIMESLDSDANGELSEKELAGLLQIRPQIVLTVNFGKSNSPPGVTVDWTQPLLKKETDQAAAADQTYFTAGARLRIAAATSGSQTFDYRQTAQSQLNQFDVDKNGYIDQKDIDESPNKQYLMTQFARWDDNGDGKVYAEEIQADYDRQVAPQRTQIYLTVTDQAPGLFGMLDASGDGRLSLRELRMAGERLKSLDKNKNGEFESDEIPGELRLQFSQGGYAYNGFSIGGGAATQTNLPAGTREKEPKWFLHMDRNGDGDISPREFLGTPEQFQKLDKNSDGFIEPAEAKAAMPE